tara:strand:- start:97 stop:420 length:324 start_codon:yes stop_codon:yes gene_type:complete
MLTESIHNEAVKAAEQATANFITKHKDRFFGCGFAWVTSCYKGNTKIGKSFINQGFTKSYNGGYQLWNPSGNHTQDIAAKEAGVDAYIDTVKKHLPGINLYAGSRLD